MAARQDQTLQIALIIFAMLLVVCLGLTYWFYKQSSDARQKISGLEQEITEERTKARNLQAENETQRVFIGIDRFAAAADVEEAFNKDMEQMANTLSESSRNYRNALSQVFKTKEEEVSNRATDKASIKTLQLKLDEAEAGHQAQIAQLNEQISKIEQQAATARNEFKAAREELDANKKSLADKLAQEIDKSKKERDELDDQIAGLNGTIQKMQRTIDKLVEERVVGEVSPEIADGEVKWVNQANSTVWINLGPADALRRQVTFSVFDSEEQDAGKAEKKGAIEVVRMLGDHMAECRVTDDDPRDPILPGDYIYSPAWHAGRPQHFALTGIIDLDGDGRSDLQLAKDLIAMNGGIVDAAPNEKGEVEGNMSIETRYLVLGEFPEKGTNATPRETWASMSDEAKSLGVEKITLTDFMNQMGYKPVDRTVSLGAGARADDFRPRPNPERGSLRPRSPYILP